MIKLMITLFLIGMSAHVQADRNTSDLNQVTPASSNQTEPLNRQICMLISIIKNRALFRDISPRPDTIKSKLFELDELLHNNQFTVHWEFIPTGENNTFYIRSSKKTFRSSKEGYDYLHPDSVKTEHGTFFFDYYRHMSIKFVKDGHYANLTNEFKWRVVKISFKTDYYMIWNVHYSEALYNGGNIIPFGWTSYLNSETDPVLNEAKYYWDIKCTNECIY